MMVEFCMIIEKTNSYYLILCIETNQTQKFRVLEDCDFCPAEDCYQEILMIVKNNQRQIQLGR